MHVSLGAAVHLCCHRLLPSVKAQFRHRGAVADFAATALAACRRPQK
ncbi:hypothetical protein ABT324_10755 [Saccharopolyspora sp. NPDC000359]